MLNITGKESNADVLFSLVGEEPVTVKTAMEIPMVSRCVNMIAGAVAMLPIRMYRRKGDGVEEITDDRRLEILNRDTGDTMNADYMRAAWVRDLLLTGSAYAYIEHRNSIPYKLYYISSENVSRIVNRIDPIHKSYRYSAGGVMVEPWQMLKILRSTDGYGGGRGVLDDSPEILGTAYDLIRYQRKQISNGGAKRGILRTNGMKKDIIAEIKAKWAAMWGAKNDNDSMFVINAADADFKELSSTSVDMQLNQTQETIDKELMKLFGTSDGLLTEETVKNAVLPVIDMIEAALDSDLLLEREKGTIYFAFDTRELTRGDIAQRYNAYATGLSSNFLQLDEVRAMEDLPPLGINFITLGLNDVLLDPKTGQIYTPNTNQYATMGENASIPLTDGGNGGNIDTEVRQAVFGEDHKIVDNVPDSGVDVFRKVFSDISVDKIIKHHESLADITPEEMYDLLKDVGFEVKPLAKGNLKGIPFENGGGFKINFDNNAIFQYHPARYSHHGGAYWKVKQGKVAQRYDLNGNTI